MFTGTMIEELIAAVELAESHARAEQEMAELEHLYLTGSCELEKCESDLVGVA